MKKLLTICLIMATVFTVNAQKLSGSLGTYSHNNIGNRYTNLNWEVSYKFEKRTDGIYLIYYNPKITVAQNSLYATADKNYSKQELGLSAWPQNYSPSSLNVSVNCRLPNGKVELSGFAFSTSDPYLANEDWVCATTLNGQEVNLSSFTLTVTKANYNPQRVAELDAIIKTKTTNSSTTTAQNSGSNNPLTTSQTSTTQTTSSIPSLESQYAKLGIPANTPTYTKQEVTNQLVTQAGNLASELINEHNANYDKKMARWQAESDANTKALWEEDYRKGEIKFKKDYSLIMEQAINGDEDARMELYFASEKFYFKKQVPERDKWFSQAVKNKNCSALLKVADKSYTYTNEDIAGLEYLASLGCIDAMVHLADLYDRTNVRIWGQNARGGDNEQKAIEWFTIAANNGSPNAMYYLGMIYKYGTTQSSRTENIYKRMHRKYATEKNEKLAFEWFTKSLQPHYKSSSFASFDYHPYYEVSEFNSGVYEELYKMYKEGKVVAKDEVKAQEFKHKIFK